MNRSDVALAPGHGVTGLKPRPNRRIVPSNPRLHLLAMGPGAFPGEDRDAITTASSCSPRATRSRCPGQKPSRQRPLKSRNAAMVVLPSRAGGGHEVPVDGCAATPATTSRKVQAAAAEVFSTHGLDAPLEEVARRAGVSIGTVYNRFGCREALIDAVAPEIVGAKLQTLAAQVVLLPSPRQRLSAFVEGMIDLQVDDPALNDAVLRRFPAAVALLAVCEKATQFGLDLLQDAHRDGSIRPDFTEEDLLALLWLAGVASRQTTLTAGWRSVLRRSLDDAAYGPRSRPPAPRTRTGRAAATPAHQASATSAREDEPRST